ncbi:MAG: hypothetical protein J5827_00655, partial [Oscillospiraceae bacterium]|nr:hypothetical protein [Oscillospiraceae bacterium]
EAKTQSILYGWSGIIRRHRTFPGTRLACIIFRHIAQKSSATHNVLTAVFDRSDENSDFVIRAPELRGVALTKCRRKAARQNRVRTGTVCLMKKP